MNYPRPTATAIGRGFAVQRGQTGVDSLSARGGQPRTSFLRFVGQLLYPHVKYRPVGTEVSPA